MDEHQHHAELVAGLVKQLGGILDQSTQPIYLYLDDNHKACNKKFSDLLGFKSPAEWAKVTSSFLETFVAEPSRAGLMAAFWASRETKAASVQPVTWINKAGKTIDSKVIMTPIMYDDHEFALHFVLIRGDAPNPKPVPRQPTNNSAPNS